MKIFLRIIGVIALIVVLMFCYGGTVISTKDAERAVGSSGEIEAARKTIESMKAISAGLSGTAKEESIKEIDAAEAKLNKIPTEGTLNTQKVLFLVLGALTLAIGVLLFIPRKKLAIVLLGAVVVLCATLLIVAPDIEKGPYSGMSGYGVALIASPIAVLLALFNFLIANITEKRKTLALA